MTPADLDDYGPPTCCSCFQCAPCSFCLGSCVECGEYVGEDGLDEDGLCEECRTPNGGDE